MESSQPRVVVVGLGSWYADDEAGWEAVKRLSNRWRESSPCGAAEVVFELASAPQDLLQWSDASCHLHVVDAVLNSGFAEMASGAVQRFSAEVLEGFVTLQPTSNSDFTWSYTDPKPDWVWPLLSSPGSSHGIDLHSTLILAHSLNLIPSRFVLWAIPIQCVGMKRGINAKTTACVDQLVDQLFDEICRNGTPLESDS